MRTLAHCSSRGVSHVSTPCPSFPSFPFLPSFPSLPSFLPLFSTLDPKARFDSEMLCLSGARSQCDTVHRRSPHVTLHNGPSCGRSQCVSIGWFCLRRGFDWVVFEGTHNPFCLSYVCVCVCVSWRVDWYMTILFSSYDVSISYMWRFELATGWPVRERVFRCRASLEIELNGFKRDGELYSLPIPVFVAKLFDMEPETSVRLFSCCLIISCQFFFFERSYTSI